MGVTRGRAQSWRFPKVPFPTWTTNHRVGIPMIVSATVVSVLIAVSGPSAVTVKLGPRVSLLPPWYLPVSWVQLGEWLVVPLLWVFLFVGVIGLWISWRAVNAGWRPNNRKLFAFGAGLSVVSCLVPPLTSADVLMYAAYGRLQVIGRNPYQFTAADYFRESWDPVLSWTERPWQDTPSVYGPLASFSQYVASQLGGTNMHDTVFWLQMFTLLAFLATSVIAVKMAHSDRKLQTRTVLFTVMNPLMLWGVLIGAHNEALSVVFAVAGLWFFRKHPFVAGIGIGLAGTIKVSMIFYGIAMLWGYRRDPRRLLQLIAGAAIPLILAYGVWMPNSLLAAQRNTGYISLAAWGWWPLKGLTPLVGEPSARQIVIAGGWILLVILAWMLSRVMPWRLVPGDPQFDNPRLDPLTITVRTAVVLCTAWLISSPWAFSWYDWITWAPLGLLWASRLDVIMMWRGAWLSVAWVTGRVTQFGPDLQVVQDYLRQGINIAAQYGVLFAIIWWWWVWGHEMPNWRGLWQLTWLKPPRGPHSSPPSSAARATSQTPPEIGQVSAG